MSRTRTIALASLPLAAILIGAGILIARSFASEGTVLTGIVEIREVDVASKIPGRIASLYIKEGEPVRQGQLLAVLTSREIDAKVGQAGGALKAAQARLQMAHNGARPEERDAVETLYRQAQHQFSLAEKTWNRVRSIYRDSIISTQEYDQAEFQYRAAKEQMEAARAKYQMVLNGTRIEELHGAQALEEQARNALNEALAYQGETRIVSPADGQMCKRIAEPGEIVSAGYPVMTVLDTADVWVTLQVREDLMPSIRMGRTISVIIPAVGETAVPFRVSYIAAMADFATWKATNQKGDFDLRTFEVRLRTEHPVPGLRPGMTARAAL